MIPVQDNPNIHASIESLTAGLTSDSLRFSRRVACQLATACGIRFISPVESLRGADKQGPLRPKSLIVLWMQGGPSQLETWDPHPGTSIGGETRSIKTRNPAVQIANFYPRLAEQFDALSVIRSLVSKEGDHERGTYYLKTGYRPDPTLRHPALGSIVAQENLADSLKLPPFVSIGPAQWAGRGGYLGETWDAFKYSDPGNSLPNMKSWLASERELRRQQNHAILEQTFRAGRKGQLQKTLHHETMNKAWEMMHSDQVQAFDLTLESSSNRLRYGDSTFGRGCLTARRLVETGVPAVEVTLDGWDSHANNYGIHKSNGEILDMGFSALVADLRERNLWDTTLVLCLGEFGRTPRINPVEGRDHWPNGFSCLIGGAGLKPGALIGATDPENKKSGPEDPVAVADLSATILRQMGVDWNRELMTPIGRPLKISDGNPLRKLLSTD